MHIHEEKPKKWPWILLVLLLFFGGMIWFAYAWLKDLTPEDILKSEFVKKQVTEQLGEDKAKLFDVLPELLGFNEPRTYLLLFLNNTELRPGGGFIGSYATVHFEKGNMEVLSMEGTERIDGNAPDTFKPQPPQILLDHLRVDRWYFRDSNWSPDFVQSSKKTLELYAGENGIAAGEIDAVIGITTTVLEELMRITGPFEIQGIEFTAENVIEKLEYEVEYGYDDKGLHFLERKQIMKPFMLALMSHIKTDVFKNVSEYEKIFTKLGKEKHILIYARDSALQNIVTTYDISGETEAYPGDYLLWVDANLAALKTDHAMQRNLTYSISQNFVASAAMKYTHTGVFDWRTSRYRTYARIFVPEGSKLISIKGSMKWDRTSESGIVDSGVENGKQWFGTFISIEPGKVGELKFEYQLPQNITNMLEKNSYTLMVQKQLGTIAHGLTLDLNFGKTITSAKPAEEEKNWHDSRYQSQTDLRIDRSFEVHF